MLNFSDQPLAVETAQGLFLYFLKDAAREAKLLADCSE
jgi:hypothetical protein